MSPKEQALVALAELQKAMPPGVPCLIIVGLPEEQEFLKLSAHLEPLGNRLLFMHAAAELLIQQEKLAGAADAPLFVLPTGKECPICLRTGRIGPDGETRCGMCGGTGRIGP